jgi:hypothetical protein
MGPHCRGAAPLKSGRQSASCRNVTIQEPERLQNFRSAGSAGGGPLVKLGAGTAAALTSCALLKHVCLWYVSSGGVSSLPIKFLRFLWKRLKSLPMPLVPERGPAGFLCFRGRFSPEYFVWLLLAPSLATNGQLRRRVVAFLVSGENRLAKTIYRFV